MSFNESQTFFFSCCRGLGPLLGEELAAFTDPSAENLEVQDSGVKVKCGYEVGLELSFNTLLAERAYLLLHKETVSSLEDFRDVLRDFPWTKVMHSNSSFRFQVKADGRVRAREDFGNTLYLIQLAKDSLVDRFADNNVSRPNVDRQQADLRFYIYLEEADGEISLELYLDLKGKPLTKRGYRLEGGIAPLREAIAAATATLALKDSQRPEVILDGLCGSGTMLFEAALSFFGVPAQWRLMTKKKSLYDWSFLHYFPIKDSGCWKRPLDKTRSRFETAVKEARNEHSVRLEGSDLLESQIQACKLNAQRFPLPERLFSFTQKDFFSISPSSGTIGLSNLPFGKRLDQQKPVEDFSFSVGEHLKKNFKGSSYTLYCEDMECFKAIRLKPDKKLTVQNGQLQTHMRRYNLF